MRRFDPLFTEADLLELWQSTIGIERETLRIKEDGQIAKTPHSSHWGDRAYHPYIQTDFAESQLEFITPPAKDSQEVMAWLAAIHQIAAQENDQQAEWMWPYSTPPAVPTDGKLKVAQLSNPADVHYREHLAKFYGVDVQLLSGIHYNFQINPRVLANKISPDADAIMVTNKIYAKLGRNYLRYRWILTYLLGAAPFVPGAYQTKLYGKPSQQPMRSVRLSRYGYMNDPKVKIRYDQFEHFVDDLEQAVEDGLLSEEKELYADVRFKQSKPVRKLMERGIDYIELRNFDLNPFAPYGISQEDIDFVKLFVITLILLPDVHSQEAVDQGNQLNLAIAEADPLAPHQQDNEVGWFFQEMKYLTQIIDQELQTNYLELVEAKERQMSQPEQTLAGRLHQLYQDQAGMVEHGLAMAQAHQEVYLDRPYLLHGFEALEISTQDVIKEAMRLGLEVEIIDPSENLIKLQHQDHFEYIRKGNMTAYDSLISYFLMENKVATKKILENAGIHTPRSESFTQIELAKAYYPSIQDKAFVIKPKSTNYGLGISIFNQGASREDYEAGLKVAFKEDKEVLIEEFIEGTEYRFYVQGDEVKAICQRQPAHVIGDGQHTVDQLIDQENQHPLRGPQHKAPMTLLAKGDIERMQLHQQGLDFDSIPDPDQIVYLRRNTNVSTGGISIDRTDDTDPSYKDLAVKASQALGAFFCGVDLIIPDRTIPANQSKYGIIEANFNPAMMIHRFVGRGQVRYLGLEVIKALFPELKMTDKEHSTSLA
ncbi:bifunctional glutamate--cysteine ligase GshA/glutathione synthetase GshB [Ignavigranum ruoffiae]|uniref:bifunctional glutamate--cysteine ligase GshA/glutathione synthetase GshB n=1 Tax=Ignavigranum ruoffiae TaxID=89093 RepID=UPI003B00DDFD